MMASEYMLRRHIKNVCAPTLKDNSELKCALCPFEDLILEEEPQLSLMFKMKRHLTREAHEAKQTQLKLKI
jgi:hypothetical protein